MDKDRRLKFYIVDDDPDLIALQTVLLDAAGHTVHSKMVGSHALPDIDARRPDCVITDLMMAELDGLELCRALRARKKLASIKIIVVSARTGLYWKQQAADAGADGYITKPLNLETYLDQIDAILSPGS